MSVILALVLIVTTSFITALVNQCPTIESFLNLVTNTPCLDDRTVRDLLPIQQHLANALLRARVIALCKQHHVLEIWRRIHILDITFYGVWGKWYVWGRHHPVITGLRDGAPLLDYIFQDASIARELAQDWQEAERALVGRGNRDKQVCPLEVFQRIAERLCQIKSPVANIDAALALLMAWQAAENARLGEPAIACLVHLVNLVEQNIDYDPIIRWVQIAVADILYKKRCEHAMEMYKKVARGNGYDDKYYKSIGQIACIQFQTKQYQTVISHTTQVLRYYRNQINVDTDIIGHLIAARFLSRLVLNQPKEIQKDGPLVQYFYEADGGNSPELGFIKRIYEAWSNHDTELYEIALRDYDRHNPMTDELIKLFLSAKERIQSKKEL